MRVEDLDAQRARVEWVGRILTDLQWLGLDWDEGPDRGGPHAPYDQGSRGALYRAAFDRLVGGARVYPCFCSRKDVAAAASAPQGPGEEAHYPGTCRDLPPGDARKRIEAGARHAFRFRADPGVVLGFDDLVRGAWRGARPCDDFVVLRGDGVPAYQLAVVVDDAQMRITEVVRGGDLLESTVRQLLLYDALDLDPPAFGHVPLLLGPDGVRLSKRHQGITLRELRDGGWSAERVVGYLAHALGLRPSPAPVGAGNLAPGFALVQMRSAPREILVDLRA